MRANRITPRDEVLVKDQVTRKMDVRVRIMQKSNMRSDRRNLCPLLELALYMLMWVKAPSANSNRNRMETGTSGSGDGNPPGNPPSAGSLTISIGAGPTAIIIVPDEASVGGLGPAMGVTAGESMAIVAAAADIVDIDDSVAVAANIDAIDGTDNVVVVNIDEVDGTVAVAATVATAGIAMMLIAVVVGTGIAMNVTELLGGSSATTALASGEIGSTSIS